MSVDNIDKLITIYTFDKTSLRYIDIVFIIISIGVRV